MPRLIIPEEKQVSLQGAQKNIGAEASAVASAGKIGEIMSRDGTAAVAGRAKIGQIQRTQGAEALASAGNQMGELIGKKQAEAAASYAQIGQTALEVGNSVMQQGKSMFNKALDSMGQFQAQAAGAESDTEYNNAYMGAMADFESMSKDIYAGEPGLEAWAKQQEAQGLSVGKSSKIANNRYKDANELAEIAAAKGGNKGGNAGGQRVQGSYKTLPQEIRNAGEQIKSRYANSLSNSPKAAQRFMDNFGNILDAKQMDAMKESRKRMMKEGTGSLNEFLDSNTVYALGNADRNSLPQYYTQATQAINNSFRNGLITYDQSVKLNDKARHDIYYKFMENTAIRDPNTAYDLLGMDPSAPRDQAAQKTIEKNLSITPFERDKLVGITTRRIEEKRREDEIRAKKDKALIKEQQTYHYDNLDLGVLQGSITSADIDGYFGEGKISHHQQITLQKSLLRQNKTELKKAESRSLISNDINQGNIIDGKYSSKSINDHYSNQIETSGASDLYNPSSGMDRARLASQYKTPVPQFTNELEGIAKAGDPDQIMSGLNAYRQVSQKSPLAISGMDEKTKAFYSVLDSQTRYSNVAPATAIERAKELTYTADNDVYRVRKNDWDNKGSPLSNAQIDKTISNMYDLDHGFFADDRVDSFAKTQLTRQLKDAYIQTGDFEAAKSMVASQTSGKFGTSEVNNIPRMTRDNSVFMYAPPESTYGPGTPTNYTAQEMRSNLNHDVQSVLVKSGIIDQSGIKPEQVLVGSGEYTNGGVGKATYSLYYLDEGGTAQPLMNPETGTPMFWKPDSEYISNSRMTDAQGKMQHAQEYDKMTGIKKSGIGNDSPTIQQNNPGNINKDGVRWDGEVPNTNSPYKEFNSPEDGIAALYNTMKSKDPKIANLPTKELIEKIKERIKQTHGYVPYSDIVIVDGITRGL